jgi:hypothetical protein
LASRQVAKTPSFFGMAAWREAHHERVPVVLHLAVIENGGPGPKLPPDAEGDFDGFTFDLPLDRMENVYFERPADAVAREVLKGGVDHKVVAACLPGLLGGETPMGFLFRYRDLAF